MMSRALAIPLYAMVGAAWGVVALLLGGRAFGPPVWAGVVAAPGIGVAVGLLTQRRFHHARPTARKAWAFVSLYLGAILFGLAMGIYDWWPGGVGQAFAGAIGEGIGGTLYGLTLGGFFIALWPLAYLTHYLLDRAEERSRGP
jgi:hypothetical protein